MKNILILILLSAFLAACGPAREDVIRYDNKINSLFESFANVYSEYALKSNSGDPQQMEDYRVYSCNNILPHIEEAKKIQPFEGNSAYANALTNYLLAVQQTMQQQDARRIKLLMKDSLMTREDSLKVKELTKEGLNITNKAYVEFLQAQKKFREDFGIKEEDEE